MALQMPMIMHTDGLYCSIATVVKDCQRLS
jgi:hypothetical protein